MLHSAAINALTVTALTYAPILAHFGHWYISVPTFMTPVVILAVAVKVSERRAVRRAREGDASRLNVAVSEQDDQTVVTVRGDADYVTLLDLEHELGLAVGRDLPIVLDLREAQSSEEDFAWGIVEAVRALEDADVTVLAGTTVTQQGLRKVCELEGLKTR